MKFFKISQKKLGNLGNYLQDLQKFPNFILNSILVKVGKKSLIWEKYIPVPWPGRNWMIQHWDECLRGWYVSEEEVHDEQMSVLVFDY